MTFKVVRFARLPEPGSDIGSPTPPTGAGDMVARVAKPIARGLDRIFRTRLADCAGCEERRRWLNDQFRNRKPPRKS